MNLYKKLTGILPSRPLQVGEVVEYADGTATIETPDGGKAQAIGEATIGDRVFFRGGAIEGPAPTLSFVAVDI